MNTDADRRKLQKQHEKDMDEVRREFTRKKDTLTEQLEAEVCVLLDIWGCLKLQYRIYVLQVNEPSQVYCVITLIVSR